MAAEASVSLATAHEEAARLIRKPASDMAGPAFLEDGLDWRSMSLSPADMDFLEARNSAAREIALALGVPLQLLGIPGDNTYANYKEANLAF